MYVFYFVVDVDLHDWSFWFSSFPVVLRGEVTLFNGFLVFVAIVTTGCLGFRHVLWVCD